MYFNQAKQGFTLIELLVVVLIVGILAAVALPQYQKSVAKSRYASLKPLTQSIANAQNLYYLANNQYATQFDQLDINIGGTPPNSASSPDKRFFPWGECQLYATFALCQNESIQMSYIIVYPGTRYCQPGGSTLSSAICKEETGISEGSWRIYSN